MPRYGHTAVLCGSRITIVGGSNGQIFYRDAWEVNLLTMQWVAMFVAGTDAEGANKSFEQMPERGILGSSCASPPRVGRTTAAAPETCEMAVRLQAMWRGALCRKLFQQMLCEANLKFDAATFLQALMRGYLTRKHLRAAIAARQTLARNG
mmetsp:Transcript_20943/g.34586  ORF Transcript_20943/g.34586 Transcript_20943/m.34586 type:complete len:151 (+) Transcript_20943:3-455(+)